MISKLKLCKKNFYSDYLEIEKIFFKQSYLTFKYKIFFVVQGLIKTT